MGRWTSIASSVDAMPSNGCMTVVVAPSGTLCWPVPCSSKHSIMVGWLGRMPNHSSGGCSDPKVSNSCLTICLEPGVVILNFLLPTLCMVKSMDNASGILKNPDSLILVSKGLQCKSCLRFDPTKGMNSPRDNLGALTILAFSLKKVLPSCSTLRKGLVRCFKHLAWMEVSTQRGYSLEEAILI